MEKFGNMTVTMSVNRENHIVSANIILPTGESLRIVGDHWRVQASVEQILQSIMKLVSFCCSCNSWVTDTTSDAYRDAGMCDTCYGKFS